MIRNLSISFLLLLLAFTVSAESHAQSSPSSVQFACVTWSPLSMGPVYYRTGEEVAEVKLSPGNRSKLLPATNTLLELFVQENDDEGNITPRVVGRTAFPAGASRVLVFIEEIHGTNAALPLRLMAIDDSLLTFPRGACRFVNLTDLTISVTFGGTQNLVKPKAMKVVRSGAPSDGAMLPFLLHDRTGKTIYENRVLAQEIGRDMIFIFPPKTRGGRVNVRLLPQLLAKTPPATTAGG